MRAFAPLVLFALAPVAVAAPVPKALKKGDDKTAHVGTWKATGVTINGSESPLSTHTFIFDADSGVRTIFNGNSASTWEVTLDMTASPRTMKWVSPGRANSSDWDCVYELSGNTLKVGFVRKGATPVKVEPADGLTLYVMTRDTTAK